MSITLDGSNVTTTGVINSGTAQATTSGTIKTFTGIPAGVKRITVMFSGVSTSGTSNLQIQIGSGSITTTGYSGMGAACGNGGTFAITTATSGFLIEPSSGASAAAARSGTAVITLLGSNIWTFTSQLNNGANIWTSGAGGVTISGTLDRIALTTVNGTDTFDAGSVNIFWE